MNPQNYPHLEISVLKLSEVLKDNPTKRMDAEYFKREWVENEERIRRLPFKKLGNLCYSICNGDDCRDYTEEGRYYIRTGDIKELGLNLEFAEKINPNFKPRTRLEMGDVLITRKGNYGKSQVVCDPKILECVISSEIFQLKVKGINPFYLDIFLRSKYGQLQFEKHIHGVSNFSVTQNAMLSFLIPLLPLDFQEHIAQLVKTAHACLEQSKALYKEAQGLLEQELGTLPKAPPKEHQIKSLKESFLSTGRLDAEFYQSKYAQIEDLLKNYKGGVCTLEDFEICDAPFEPQPNTTYRYVELAHIGNYGNILTPTEALGAHLPTRARRLAQSGDVLLSSVAGSLSRCALVPASLSPCVVSTGFFVLRSKRFNPETLLTLFKSPLFQAYLTKFPSGTILCALSKSVLHSVLLPKIPLNVQEQIAALLQESLKHREQAKVLLTQAKARAEHALTGGGGGLTAKKPKWAFLKKKNPKNTGPADWA
ncbi:restriction endonuclease subunit S, partial [Helicobacter ailurogastricus]|uniref:restriction endonuclease subunit S n=1 Tax=Helicobacter ailurogastricus TaxID=1578720 RepID=UPI002557C2F3